MCSSRTFILEVLFYPIVFCFTIDRSLDDRKKSATIYKSEKRDELVGEGYRLHGNSGDQWSDLVGSSTSNRSFKLPNSMYYIPWSKNYLFIVFPYIFIFFIKISIDWSLIHHRQNHTCSNVWVQSAYQGQGMVRLDNCLIFLCPFFRPTNPIFKSWPEFWNPFF